MSHALFSKNISHEDVGSREIKLLTNSSKGLQSGLNLSYRSTHRKTVQIYILHICRDNQFEHFLMVYCGTSNFPLLNMIKLLSKVSISDDMKHTDNAVSIKKIC